MNYNLPHKIFLNAFAEGLLNWNKLSNKRVMPWKGEKDPYKIWLSEIILQQTRVEQGLEYYNRFVKTFPTVQQLAAAPEQEVFKLWEGLGYYTRCKNLIHTARYIANELGGEFPKGFENILALKGVGPYTAAAIASFAYNLPHAVLDGNVFRVLSRVFDVELPIDSTEGKKYFASLAQEILPADKAGAYNQAIMDFGATICKPQPECAQCFFNRSCKAFLGNKQAALPVKEKKLRIKERWFHYIILQWGDEIAIRQRNEKDIWQSLWDVLLIEGDHKWDKDHLLAQLKKSYAIEPHQYEVISAAASTSQRLTHQYIHFSFLHLHLLQPLALKDFIWVSAQKRKSYPFPKTLQAFLDKNL